MKRFLWLLLVLALTVACTEREDIVPDNPQEEEDPAPEKPDPEDKEDKEDDPEDKEDEPEPLPDSSFVNIPDSTFKAYLIARFDTDNDGEISPEEAQEIIDIDVTTDSINTLQGIRYFKNLQTLTCRGYRDEERSIMGRLHDTLDLSGLKNLKTLRCRHNHITLIKLSKNNALTSVEAYGNSLVELDLRGAPALEDLDAGDCEIRWIDVSECHSLKSLYVHNNQLKELDLRWNPQLQSVRCEQNPLERILLSAGHTIRNFSAPDGASIEYDYNALPVPYLGTGLRSLYIRCNGNISKDKWLENCSVYLMDDSGALYYKSDSLSIQGRGNTTWSYPKKPYKIKLNSKTDLLGKGKSKRYVLLANWMDRTLLRNDVAFELARRTSLPWTPSGEFVELFINGQHRGNYWLGEQIRVESSRIKADYLIEMDTYYDETWRFKSTWGYKPNTRNYGLPIGVKYPDDDDLTQEQFQEVKDLVAGVENAIYNGGDFLSKIDLDSIIDWYLVHEVTYNGEPNHPKSCYFHFKDGVMIAGPVWDFDWYTFQPNTSGLFIPESIYFKELFKDRSVVARLKERWAELRPLFLDVVSYISERAGLIQASEAINHQMWPCYYNVNEDDYLSFDNAISRMRSALSSRIESIDAALGAL